MGKFKLIAAAAVILVSALIAMVFSQEQAPLAVYGDQEQFERLVELQKVIDENYYQDVEVRRVFAAALNGMLNKLDPHSLFFDAVDYAQREEEYRGNYQGIGVTFVMLEDKITVVDVVGGGPSDRAGLKMGDRIVEIEGENAIGIENNEVQRRLRGPENSEVSVMIERPQHADLIPVTITRGRISIPSVVNVIKLDEDTGYIRINRFASPTSIELEQALMELESMGMKQLVLDLRGNTGGLLETAIGVTDKFLPGRRLIVFTQGRVDGSRYTFYSKPGNRYWDLPLVMLIDHISASGSEIVAGAIQDWDRGVIVGQTSFGKGLVQTNYALSDRSRLMLTTARYYTPSGRLIQRDYEGVDLDMYQLQGLDDYDPNDIRLNGDDGDRPRYTTADGRPVYGGGGITPDEVVEGEPIFDRLVYAFNYQLHLFRYAAGFYGSHPELAERYEIYRLSYDNYDESLRRELLDRFNEEFSVSDEMLREFLEFALEKGFEFYTRQGELLTDEELKSRYWELKDQMRLYLKAEVAQFCFGRNAGFHLRRAISGRDSQLARARELFGKAAELSMRQVDIDPGVFAERRISGGN